MKPVTPEHRGDIPAEPLVGIPAPVETIVHRQRVRLLARSFIDNRLLEAGEVIFYDGLIEKHMEVVE